MTIRIHWGLAVAVFYTGFAVSTVGFVAFAMTQEVQLVSPDYYAKSLKHDAHMQAVANAEAMAPALQVQVQPGGHAVRVQWPAGMASRVRGTATLYRPADAKADRTTPLVPDVDGAVTLSSARLPGGHWRLKLQWSADGRDFYAERDLVLR